MNADERRSQAWDEFFNGPFKTAVETAYDESAGWTIDLLKGVTQVAASSFRAGWQSRGGDVTKEIGAMNGTKPRIVLALDESGCDALYVDGKLTVRDQNIYAVHALVAVRDHFGIAFEILELVMPDGQDFPQNLQDARQFVVPGDESRVTGHESRAGLTGFVAA